MMLERADGEAFELDAAKARLEAAFQTVMRGRAENDGYNALVLTAGLPWRDVALLRTISRFLRQARLAYSQDYMWATLRRHPALAALIVQLFHPRFDPRLGLSDKEREDRQAAVSAEIETALGAVASLDEDRILRHFVNAVSVALRTSFYQLDQGGQTKPTIAIKFESRKLDRPAAAEAALRDLRLFAARRGRAPALRQGRARRLALVRPAAGFPHRGARPRQGAAGQERRDRAGRRQGRLRAEEPSDRGPRDAIQTEGTAAYTLFVASLLDITDNLGAEGVIPPPNVIRHDGDDPYLVVAADKGTATFSDTANGISAEYDFWLGDAFASGGSAGYDHKKMGITARGAWEAVRRHFREMDVDIQHDAVHGRGRRRHVGRRVRQRHAARAHHQAGGGVRSPRHLHRSRRPTRSAASPSASGCSISRARAGRTTTRSYISAGGGVYSRSAKEIPLSAEARALLGLAAEKVTPQEVMRAILKARDRSALVRRHRHLHPRVERDRRSGRRPRQRRDPHHRRRPALQGDRRGRQPRHDAARPRRGGACAACGSTPTRSTTRPA